MVGKNSRLYKLASNILFCGECCLALLKEIGMMQATDLLRSDPPSELI